MKLLMRPLANMNGAMTDIARGEGDLTRRLPVINQDEFVELTNAINTFTAGGEKFVKDVDIVTYDTLARHSSKVHHGNYVHNSAFLKNLNLGASTAPFVMKLAPGGDDWK